MMRNNRTSLAAAAVLPLLGLTLAGCAAPADSPEPEVLAGLQLEIAVDEAVAALLPEAYADEIRVAIDVPNPPFELFDEKQNIIGFDPDFAVALGQKLGVKITVSQIAWDSLVPSLQSEQQDIIVTGMNDTKERQENLNFVDYVYGGFSILVQEGNPTGITNIFDLCGETVAVQKATVQGDILKDMDEECIARGGEPVIVSELPAEEDARTAVRAGKAVADVFDSAQARYIAENAGGGKHFDLVEDPDAPNGYFPVYSGIATLKSNTGLADALKAALQSLIDDGNYAKLLAHHGLSNYAVDEAMLNAG